jgi:hypothetical protein
MKPSDVTASKKSYIDRRCHFLNHIILSGHLLQIAVTVCKYSNLQIAVTVCKYSKYTEGLVYNVSVLCLNCTGQSMSVTLHRVLL